jgi:hypothetical protein
VDSPASSRISFHEVEEPTMTGFSQALAEIEAMASDEQFFAPESVTEATVAGIHGQVLIIEHHPYRLVPRESDGDEVGQEGGR